MMQFELLTTNRFGVLSRIVSIVSSFGANIETVQVYPAEASGLSVVQFLAEGSPVMRERLRRKLTRLVDVVECHTVDAGAREHVVSTPMCNASARHEAADRQ